MRRGKRKIGQVSQKIPWRRERGKFRLDISLEATLCVLCMDVYVCVCACTSAQQRTKLISSVQVASQFGMEASLEDIVIARRLR